LIVSFILVHAILVLCFQVAAEIAAPLSQARKVTMVSIGKGDVGAAKLTGEVLEVMEKLPKVVEGMTGVNITKVCGQVVTGTYLVRLEVMLTYFVWYPGNVAEFTRNNWISMTGYICDTSLMTEMSLTGLKNIRKQTNVICFSLIICIICKKACFRKPSCVTKTLFIFLKCLSQLQNFRTSACRTQKFVN
jgi:hypothetical protein